MWGEPNGIGQDIELFKWCDILHTGTIFLVIDFRPAKECIGNGCDAYKIMLENEKIGWIVNSDSKHWDRYVENLQKQPK